MVPSIKLLVGRLIVGHFVLLVKVGDLNQRSRKMAFLRASVIKKTAEARI